MRSYIIEKIERCKAELMHALDSNDYMSAIKLRAVQREFEELLQKIADEENVVQDTIREMPDYYTSRDAARALGVHPSSVTRRAAHLRGQKVNGRWYFPKEVIDEEAKKIRGRPKPGRKPRSNEENCKKD